MTMTNEEIIRDYRQARNKSKQIKILAELNNTHKTPRGEIMNMAECLEIIAGLLWMALALTFGYRIRRLFKRIDKILDDAERDILSWSRRSNGPEPICKNRYPEWLSEETTWK